jgi:hypothetical protein
MMGIFEMKMIWNDMDDSNNFTSSLEIMSTKITHALKYVNALPQGSGPREAIISRQPEFLGERLC